MKLVIRVLQVCDWLGVVRDALLEGLLRLLCVPCTDARECAVLERLEKDRSSKRKERQR